MIMYTVKLFISEKPQYSGEFDFETLAQTIHKIKNNMHASPFRMQAKLALQEVGEANYWDAHGNHAKITKS